MEVTVIVNNQYGVRLVAVSLTERADPVFRLSHEEHARGSAAGSISTDLSVREAANLLQELQRFLQEAQGQ